VKLLGEERGVAIAYLTVFLVVIAVAFIWIVCNELLLHIGEWANTGATESFGFTYNWLILLFRVTPFVLFIGAVIWALLQAHRHSEYG